MLTPVLFLITNNNVNIKVQCGNKRVEGTVKTSCLGDRCRHSMTATCRSVRRIIAFHERFGSYAQDKRAKI